jgi:hypothetical protein
MKKLLIIIIAMLIFVNISFADEVLPWDDKGILRAGYKRMNSDTWSHWIGELEKEYIDRFGEIPDFMVLEDKKRPIIMEWTVYFDRTRSNWDFEAAWGDTLYWRDVSKYLYWRLESVKTGNVIFLPVRQGDPDELVSENIGRNGWLKRLKLDLNEVEIPNDGSAHKMSIEAHVGDPVDGKGLKFEPDTELMFPEIMDWIYIAKSTLQTPLDYYLWGIFEGKLGGENADKELLLMLNGHYKYSTRITESLCRIYYKENKPDSLRWIARDFLKSNEKGMDPFSVSMEKEFEMMKDPDGNYPIMISTDHQEYVTAIELIHDMLFKLDGDTTIFK